MDSIFEALARYSALKNEMSLALGASEDLLHLHAGLVIFFLAALVFRRRMRSRVPIALVYAFACGNELIDALSPSGGGGPWEPVADILNTVLWPTLLFLLARRRGRAGDRDRTI